MPLCITKYKCAFCGDEFATLRKCQEHEATHNEGVDLDGLKLPVRFRSRHVKVESRELELRMDHFVARWELQRQPNNELLQLKEAESFRRLDCYLRGVKYQQEAQVTSAA